MDEDRKISPLMRVFTGLLAGCIVLFMVIDFSSGGLANWVSSLGGLIGLMFVAALLTLCLYFTIVGRSP